MGKNAKETLESLRGMCAATVRDGKVRSLCRLSRIAGVDAPGLYKFLDDKKGSDHSKTSFVFAASLLYAIGGDVLLPDVAVDDSAAVAVPTKENIEGMAAKLASALIASGDKRDLSLAVSLMMYLQGK